MLAYHGVTEYHSTNTIPCLEGVDGTGEGDHVSKTQDFAFLTGVE